MTMRPRPCILHPLLLLPALALPALAQNNVTLSQIPPQTAITTIIHYTSNVADYICKALSTQPNVSTIAVSTISNANPGVMTATAHGIYYQSGLGSQVKALVFISGATGGWATLNGFQVVTPTSANALQIVGLDTTGFGSFSGQTITVSTRVPLTTSKVWSVSSILSDASGNPTVLPWAVTVPTTGTLANLTGGQTGFSFACAAPSSAQ